MPSDGSGTHIIYIDVVMKIPFRRLLKIIISIIVFECYTSLAFSSTFSKQYNQLLDSVNNKSFKPQKCYFNDTITTLNQAIDIYFKPITNATHIEQQSDLFKEPLQQEAEPLTLLETCQIIYDQVEITLAEMWQDFKAVYIQTNSSSKLQYYQNFASVNGGAMIISISSKSIRAPQALLEDNNDRYMYTDSELPLEIVIALKEEVSIDRIVIKSNQYYSSSIKQFVFYGAFSLEKGQENWFRLVAAQAKNHAGEQEFRTVNKVIRFLKMKVISAYGDWKYFTMTQIKVYGNSLYAEAMNLKMKEPANDVVLEPEVDISGIYLYEDLKKMITLARDGNRMIPQNNLMKYFFQELQKLSKIQQQQILYMNDLTVKIQGLENQTMEPKEESEDLKKMKQKISILESRIQEITSNEEEWSQTTLIAICVISSFIVTSTIFIILFLMVFKFSNPTKTAYTSTSSLTSSPLGSKLTLFSSLPASSTIGSIKDLLFTTRFEKEKDKKSTKKLKTKQSKR